ncbi:MsnO8 family LLM class oxidoreductase [Deinococcus multiflagellatus]|uniref:MsnO8 family LLM class oxidoreductase n=1 Tax=Deinococcus multiflagellatus TaxID=1656887 RepID=UPI001CCF188C|nr:MsnO8 family LLM class oxidoreductase [Deinococcus multiflagellatus]MBZ9715007.1 MsnO8 family LLM class oxidoreductase [Deinococcus multiflagellatus]
MTVQLSLLDPVPLVSGQRPHDALHDALLLAQSAEACGYGRVWYAEHHLPGAAACPAPAVLISAVAASTTRLRVGAGGVALRHHAPWHVAETFATLDALYPGRIDLGVAGGVGADEATVARLGGDGTPLPERLAALDGALRALGAGVQGWVLGNSARSAAQAAGLGWHYGSGNVVGNPGALAQYRAGHSGARHARPWAALAVAVVCAETTAEALRLAASHRAYLAGQGLAPGGLPVPPPAEAPALPGPLTLYPSLVVGDPITVRSALTALARRYAADELVLLTITHSAAARRRSYQLVADAFAHQPLPRPAPAPQPGGYA